MHTGRNYHKICVPGQKPARNSNGARDGFIQLIVILVLFIVILSLLGVSLSSVSQNEIVRDNFGFIRDWAVFIWNNYLKTPSLFVWNFFITYIWDPVMSVVNENIDKGRAPAMPPFVE